jgi:hypothetical protein
VLSNNLYQVYYELRHLLATQSRIHITHIDGSADFSWTGHVRRAPQKSASPSLATREGLGNGVVGVSALQEAPHFESPRVFLRAVLKPWATSCLGWVALTCPGRTPTAGGTSRPVSMDVYKDMYAKMSRRELVPDNHSSIYSSSLA